MYLLFTKKIILNRMKEKAHRALVTAQNSPPHPRADGAAWGIKQEEVDDEFAVFAGRTKKVYRTGNGPPPVLNPHAPVNMDPTPDEHAAQAHVHGGQQGQSMLGEWLARQEQYVGYDPHYLAPIEPPPPPPPHQHQQYGYPPTEQPQYTLEVAPPLQQYITAPFAYAPHSQPPPPPPPLPPQSRPPSSQPPPPPPPPSSSSLGPHGPHGSHGEDMVGLRRGYAAAAALAPQTELTHLGLASSGSRINEAWMSFMQQHTGMLNDSGSGRHM
jgi:hypothetical protein